MNIPSSPTPAWQDGSCLLTEECSGTGLATQVLNERERWAAETQALLAAKARSVVRLSARMPASLRLRGLADAPLARGAEVFEAACRSRGLLLQHLGPGRGPLGPWVLWSSRSDPLLLKQTAVLVEEGDSHGQLLDLDVYSHNGPVSRARLGLPARNCLVCGQPAAVCTGRAIHHPETIQAAFLALLERCSVASRNSDSGTFPNQFLFIPQDLRTDTPLAFNRP